VLVSTTSTTLAGSAHGDTAPTRPRPSFVRTVIADAAAWTASGLDVVLVQRDLDRLPQAVAPDGVSLRSVTQDDLPALTGLWPSGHGRLKTRQFRVRLARGYTCLGAFEGGRLLAIDWLNSIDFDASVEATPGTWLGIDLYERPDQTGRGVGSALLAHSLAVARTAGYRRQAAYVDARNTRMLAAAIGLLGFTSFGSAHRQKVVGRVRWRWTIDGAAGAGPVLVL